MSKEQLPDGEELNNIRDFCVRGLAESVPEHINPQQAEDMLVLWFPGDTFALEALYRRISSKGELDEGKAARTRARRSR